MLTRPFLLALALASGLAAAQFPGFSQQYVQRLGGAVDALAAEAQAFDASARDAGLTRGEALNRYAASGDPFLMSRGDDMTALLTRFEALRGDLATLQFAGPFGRLTHVARLTDPEVAARTWESFEPSVPVTATGFSFTAGGFAGGYALGALVLGLIRLPFRRRQTA
ncbi:MAG: DUF2937 family protein [Pseudomonadota bacterium]